MDRGVLKRQFIFYERTVAERPKIFLSLLQLMPLSSNPLRLETIEIYLSLIGAGKGKWQNGCGQIMDRYCSLGKIRNSCKTCRRATLLGFPLILLK